MYSRYHHINWKEKIEQLCLTLNISRAEFIARLPKLSELYTGMTRKNQIPSESVIKSICRGFDVNEAWMRGEVEEPILNSETWVRSSDDEILSRILQLKEADTAEQFAAKIGVSVSFAKTILESKTRLSYRNANLIAEAYHVSTEWLIYGFENSREYPLNDRMWDYLMKHPEIRKMIWVMMNHEESNDEESNGQKSTGDDPDNFGDSANSANSANTPPIDFSALLKSIRKRENLTQRDLAKALCISTGLVSLIETGRRGITEGLMRKIKESFPTALTSPDLSEYSDADDTGDQGNQESTWIKSIRKQRKLTQKQFGEALGVKETKISDLERGKQKINSEMMRKIEETFGVSYPNTNTE